MSLNVLITAGSRRVALVQAFQRALAATGGGRVIVTDINPLSPAVHVADRSHPAPLSTDPGYLDEILRLCRADRVGLVVPTIDDELTLFAEAAPRFADRGIRVAVSPPETTRVCDDKYATCRALIDRGVSAVTSWLPDALPETPSLPLFIKPRHGRGSVSAYPVRSARELDFFLHYVPDPVVQSYLEGPEYTIDMLCSFAGAPLAIVPRERVVIRAGVTDRGRTVRDPRLISLAMACARALPCAGAVNIQCRMHDGAPVVFEINPRFSGGIALTLAAGADFVRALVDMTRGRPLSISSDFTADLWMTSFESSIFIGPQALGFSPSGRVPSISEVA